MYNLYFRSATLVAGLGLVACGGAASDEQGTVSEAEQNLISIGGDYDDDDDDNGGPVVIEAIDPGRELLITHLSVVEDPVRTTWPAGIPGGSQAAWTFGRLMEQMAGSSLAAPQFCKDWLMKWDQDQLINGHTASARPLIKELVINPWLAASGGVKLNMRKAPFRLLAIVNRLDLRSGASGSKSAGEGRFVFGAVKPDGSPMAFTIILEYGIPASDGEDVKEWAEDWHALGEIPFGAAFNKELEKLTKSFTKPYCAPWRPNGSCINQIRTNEAALDPNFNWELREFRLTAQGKLAQVVSVQTPDASVNGTDALALFINSNQDAVKQRTHVVSSAMLAASVPSSMSSFWSAPGIVDNDARHAFALTTCDGCHTTETGATFLHVKNRAAGVASGLSGYLTGATVNDPVSGLPRTFSELASRAVDMQIVLTSDDDEIFDDDD